VREEQPWHRWQGEDLMLSLRVQPRAKSDELVGPEGGHLKVRLTAPPVEGKANAHLRRFLAREFGVPRSRVELLAGAGGRLKRVCIRAPRKLPLFIDWARSPRSDRA
jgi:uncharacterized protein (TIGR00251 family)